MRSAVLNMPAVADDIVNLGGGLDLVTPRLELSPGAARRMVNFECGINGGYARIRGYERFDGRDSPSSKTYTLLPIKEFYYSPLVGVTLTGGASGATGTIIAVGSDHLAVTQLVGTFEQEEMVNASGTVVGKVGPQTVRLSKSVRKQYVNKAADVWRAFIEEVPGSGPVRGVFGAVLNGQFGRYAFRDSTDGAQCLMYKATPAGWELIEFTIRVEFYDGGPVQLEEGTYIDYIGFPYLIQRVIHQSGSWAANTAAGWIVLRHPSGGNNGSGAFVHLLSPYTHGSTTFKTKKYAGKIQQRPGGRYQFVQHNFSGRYTSSRVYGCDGANHLFEFDGDVFAPIPTLSGESLYGGATGTIILPGDDRPSHVMPHQEHLFVAIGSSILASGPGVPYMFNAIAGGFEGATGDIVTGLQVLPGEQGSGSMAVMGRNQTKVLYGTALAGPEPFDLVPFETKTGAIAGTLQTIDRVYYVDDRGIIDLKTAQDYGNFAAATITRFIQPLMDLKRGRAVCSAVNRSKNQYRVFFVDGTGLFITLDNGKLKGIGPVAFPHQFTCAWSGEDESGAEHTFVGGRDGFVYEMECGTSFDGAAIDFELMLAWNAIGSPRFLKTIHGSCVEFSEDTDHVEITVAARMGPELTASPAEEVSHISEAEVDAQWDHFQWDSFWYDGELLSPMELDVRGTAERIQLYFKGSSDYLEPFTMTSIISRYFKRRGVRG